MEVHSTNLGVWFPQWAQALEAAPVSDSVRVEYRRAIGYFLHFCKLSHQRATIDSAREFMQGAVSQRHLNLAQQDLWKAALNWFFQSSKSTSLNPPSTETRQISAPCSQDKVPPLAARDLGGPPWEQKLILVLRSRHYEWRTEQAYRMWARRFALWLTGRGKTVEAAGEMELRDFLSELATQHRVAIATQKQALNALVFLVRESLGHTLSDFSNFTRSKSGRRMPVVLTPEECGQNLGMAMALSVAAVPARSEHGGTTTASCPGRRVSKGHPESRLAGAIE